MLENKFWTILATPHDLPEPLLPKIAKWLENKLLILGYILNPQLQPNNNVTVNPFQGGQSVAGTGATGYNAKIGGAYTFSGISDYKSPDITDVANGGGTAYYNPLYGHQKGILNIMG